MESSWRQTAKTPSPNELRVCGKGIFFKAMHDSKALVPMRVMPEGASVMLRSSEQYWKA